MRDCVDHLVTAAETLAEGKAWLTDLLGVAPEAGGRHDFMGTHNLLWRLGPRDYLELISVDPDAKAPPHPRWFGLDDFSGPPRLICWVMRQDPLIAPEGSHITQAARGDLRWRITIPDSGLSACGGLAPLLIDWGDGPHPAEMMPDRSLSLIELDLTHPQPPSLRTDDPRLRIATGAACLTARLSTPQGEVRL